MKEKWQRKTAIPSLDQIEAERKRYRWQKAYFKALRGTISVLTYMAAVAALIATLVLPVLQIEGTSMEPTLVNGDIVLLHDEFSSSVEAALGIVDNLMAKGYTFVTVNELMVD